MVAFLAQILQLTIITNTLMKAEYNVLWSDTMDDPTGAQWPHTRENKYEFAHVNSSCPSSPCLLLTANGRYSSVDAHQKDIALYSSLKLVFDVRAESANSADIKCQIWKREYAEGYKVLDEISETNKLFSNYSVTLCSPCYTSSMYIALQADGNGYCYFDNVRLLASTNPIECNSTDNVISKAMSPTWLNGEWSYRGSAGNGRPYWKNGQNIYLLYDSTTSKYEIKNTETNQLYAYCSTESIFDCSAWRNDNNVPTDAVFMACQSLNPTQDPTMNPSSNPTIFPTIEPVINTPETIILQTNDGTSKKKEKRETDKIPTFVVYICIGIVLFLCFICCCFVFVGRRHRRKNRYPSTETPGTKSKGKDGQEWIAAWLRDIEMERYFYSFSKNGYDTKRAVKAIESKQELKQIGVNVLGHQSVIMAEIKRMNEEQMTLGGYDMNPLTPPPVPSNVVQQYEKIQYEMEGQDQFDEEKDHSFKTGHFIGSFGSPQIERNETLETDALYRTPQSLNLLESEDYETTKG